MTIPPSLDFDKIVRPVLIDATEALKGWLSGHPRDETAFLNRLTEKLNRRRRRCDVGAAAPMDVETSLAMLHRRGNVQTDAYGCDLAVTVKVEPSLFLKTALFQFKRSSGFSTVLDRAQLDQAMIDPRFGDRAFVLVLEEERHAFRIKAMTRVRADFKDQAAKTFNATSWLTASEWLFGWLRCSIGPSSLEDHDNVESELRSFVIEPFEPSLFEPGESVGLSEFDVVPARAWLQVSVTPSGPEQGWLPNQ